MALRSSTLLNRLLAKARLRHLYALVRLAELGNVNRAAQAMGLTQPAVTLLLADLENLFEAQLFLRHARGVTPTDLTRELLPLAREMLSRLAESAELAASRHDQHGGLVRIAATPAAANGLLPGLIPDFCRTHPQIQLLVTETETPQLATLLAQGSADLVFCREPTLVPQGWRFVACQPDCFVVACGHHHPLTTKRRVTIKDLRDAIWLPGHTGSAAREQLEAVFEQHGLAPNPHSLITHISVLTWTLLDAQPLLALVPRSVLAPWLQRGQLRELPVELPLPLGPLGMLLPQQPLPQAGSRLVSFITRGS